MIVLRETEWAESMIRNHDLGKKPVETLIRVARYYLDKNFSAAETRKKMDLFLIQCDPVASLPKWSNTLDFAVRAAKKRKPVNIDRIDITEPEMYKIDLLDGVQIRRLAFTLLCIAKYGMEVSGGKTDYWVGAKDSEIMSMANINTSIKRQSQMYHTLRSLGMIQFAKRVDNTSVRVCFAHTGETVMSVADFRNLGYQYLKHKGGRFFECKNCGITTKVADGGRVRKYCPECAAKIKASQDAECSVRNTSHPGRPHTYSVYIHESPDGKRYVGMTQYKLSRKWRMGDGYMSNKDLYSDIVEYGWDCFAHYLVMETSDRDEAESAVNALIKKYKTYDPEYGYNRRVSMDKPCSCPVIESKFIRLLGDGSKKPENKECRKPSKIKGLRAI